MKTFFLKETKVGFYNTQINKSTMLFHVFSQKLILSNSFYGKQLTRPSVVLRGLSDRISRGRSGVEYASCNSKKDCKTISYNN